MAAGQKNWFMYTFTSLLAVAVLTGSAVGEDGRRTAQVRHGVELSLDYAMQQSCVAPTQMAAMYRLRKVGRDDTVR